jgi:hypothetical protein
VKKLAILGFVAVAGVASAQYDHSQLINNFGGGTGAIAGADLSQLENTPVVENIFGYGAQTTFNNIMADDFTVSAGGFTAESITFFSYQTGAVAPSILTASWALGAAPSTSLTLSAVTASWWMPNGVGVYRVTSTDTSGSTRRIQAFTVDIPDVNLAAGVHFVSAHFAGAGASGPWLPPLPTSNAVWGQNAQQSIAGGAFGPVFVDAALTLGADMPFIINGTPIPEPATMIALGAGIAALAARRRRKTA